MQSDMTVRKRVISGLAALALGIAAFSSSAAVAETRSYYGYATDLKTGEYRYTEVHKHQYEGDRWLSGSMKFYAPDGRFMGDKILDFSKDPYIPLVRFTLGGERYQDAITVINDQTITVETQRDGIVERERISRSKNLAADSGFNAFLVDNLSAFKAGKSVNLSLVVIGRRDDYRFKAIPKSQLDFGGEKAIRVRIEPDSLLRYLVDPIDVIYGLESKSLLRYEGISNVLDRNTGKPFNVRIDYRVKPVNAPMKLPSI
ncbi:MAG: hypothetical protein ABIR53_01685 [Paraperlucidibaca sp.]